MDVPAPHTTKVLDCHSTPNSCSGLFHFFVLQSLQTGLSAVHVEAIKLDLLPRTATLVQAYHLLNWFCQMQATPVTAAQRWVRLRTYLLSRDGWASVSVFSCPGSPCMESNIWHSRCTQISVSQILEKKIVCLFLFFFSMYTHWLLLKLGFNSSFGSVLSHYLNAVILWHYSFHSNLGVNNLSHFLFACMGMAINICICYSADVSCQIYGIQYSSSFTVCGSLLISDEHCCPWYLHSHYFVHCAGRGAWDSKRSLVSFQKAIIPSQDTLVRRWFYSRPWVSVWSLSTMNLSWYDGLELTRTL